MSTGNDELAPGVVVLNKHHWFQELKKLDAS